MGHSPVTKLVLCSGGFLDQGGGLRLTLEDLSGHCWDGIVYKGRPAREDCGGCWWGHAGVVTNEIKMSHVCNFYRKTLSILF